MAGIAWYSLAILAKVGKQFTFFFDHAKVPSFLSMYSALQYKEVPESVESSVPSSEESGCRFN